MRLLLRDVYSSNGEERMPGINAGLGIKQTRAFIMLACCGTLTLSACGAASTPPPSASPTITQVTTSDKSFSIDCPPTAITVSAQITAASGVAHASLWYRVDTSQPYTSKNMDASNHIYSATVKGIDLPAGPYGALEFYITAEDTAGHKSQTPLDQSIQFLPCVSH